MILKSHWVFHLFSNNKLLKANTDNYGKTFSSLRKFDKFLKKFLRKYDNFFLGKIYKTMPCYF